MKAAPQRSASSTLSPQPLQRADTLWHPAYVGLGSNLDDPPKRIAEALEGLANLPHTRLVLASSPQVTAPFGPVAQPDFVNAVAGVLTRLAPGELLAALLALERRLGRVRDGTRWGPRRIDLDLLVYADARIAEPQLALPHPGIAERAFVLEPLAEIAPDLEIPGVGTVAALAAALRSDAR